MYTVQLYTCISIYFSCSVDDDECETASCGAAVCKNTPGGYDCVCPDGSITTTESCESECSEC